MRFKSTLSLIPILLPLIIIAAAPPRVAAQVDEKEKAEKELAKRQELEKKTLSLLDETIGAAWSLKLPANRSYVLASAAELLWPHDEKRARNLFWEALNNLNLPPPPASAAQNAKQANNSDNAPRPNGSGNQQFEAKNQDFATPQARSEFLYRVARRDLQLALDMMRSTRQPPPQFIGPLVGFDPEASLEDQLAAAGAANDPKRGLQLAQDSLAKGLTFEILNLLYQVNQKDADAGAQLARDVIAKLDAENFDSSPYAATIASELLIFSRTKGAILTGNPTSNSSFKRLNLDDDQKRDLVYLLADAALSVTPRGNILQNVLVVMSEIEQYAPDRVAKLKNRLNEYYVKQPEPARQWAAFQEMFENATPEEMIKAKNKVPEDQRAALFSRAAAKAVERGEADRYRELVNSQIEDNNERTGALDSLNSQQMYYDMSQGKTDELEKLLPLIGAKEQRAIATSELAVLLEKRGKHDEAVKLLDEARALVKVDLTNETQSNALLAVMFGYALVAPAKAFAMIEPIVDRANDDISKLLLLDKVIKTGALKNGEIILNQPQIPLDFAMLQYSPGVAALGKADFDRTKALADRFQRNELRIVARLLLAQSILKSFEK